MKRGLGALQRQDDVGQLRQRRIAAGDGQNARAVAARQFHGFQQFRGDPGQRTDNDYLFGTEAGRGDRASLPRRGTTAIG